MIWKVFILSYFEYRYFRSGRLRIQNFWKHLKLEKKYSPETQFLSSIFIEKSGCDENFTSEKKSFDSICSTENNKFFTFRAYFKRHDFELNLSIENRVLKWNFLKKNSKFEWSFFLQTDQFLNQEFFVLADFDTVLFEKWFCGDKIFLKLWFWVQYKLRNQISIKTSRLRNNVLTRFAPQTTTSFSLLVLILKGMILKQAFSLKIRVWNGIFWKKIRILKWSFFLQIDQVLNREFFVLAGFEKFFSNNRFVEREFFLKFRFWIQFSLRNQISIKTSHIRNKVLTRFAPHKTLSCSLFVLIFKGMTL